MARPVCACDRCWSVLQLQSTSKFELLGHFLGLLRRQMSFARPPDTWHTGADWHQSFPASQLFFQPLSQSLRMVMHLGEPLPIDRPTFYFDFAVLVLFFMVPVSILAAMLLSLTSAASCFNRLIAVLLSVNRYQTAG